MNQFLGYSPLEHPFDTIDVIVDISSAVASRHEQLTNGLEPFWPKIVCRDVAIVLAEQFEDSATAMRLF